MLLLYLEQQPHLHHSSTCLLLTIEVFPGHSCCVPSSLIEMMYVCFGWLQCAVGGGGAGSRPLVDKKKKKIDDYNARHSSLPFPPFIPYLTSTS